MSHMIFASVQLQGNRSTMIATNVVSLVKKIVKTGDGEIGSAGGTGSAAGEGSTIGVTRGGALSKLKQSVASGIQGFSQPAKTPPTTPTKLFNRELTGHLTEEERCILEKVFEKEQQFEMMQKQGASGGASTQLAASDGTSSQTESGDANNDKKLPAGKGKASFGECRICRKMFSKDEPRKVCDECKSPICEDCASYTSDNVTIWRCSLCRRRCTSIGLGMDTASGAAGIHRVPSVRRMEQGSACQRSQLTDLVSHTAGGGTRASFMLPDSYREALIMEIEQQRQREEQSRQNEDGSAGATNPNSLSTLAIGKPIKRGSYAGTTEFQKNTQSDQARPGGESLGGSPNLRRNSSRLQHRTESAGERVEGGSSSSRRSSSESTGAHGSGNASGSMGGGPLRSSPGHSFSSHKTHHGQSQPDSQHVPYSATATGSAASHHRDITSLSQQQLPHGHSFSDGSGDEDDRVRCPGGGAPSEGESHLTRQTPQSGRQKSRRRSRIHRQDSRKERRHSSKDEEGNSDPEWQGRPDDYNQRYDQTGNRRRCSSESSDISDVSGDYSAHSDRSSCTYGGYYKPPLSPVRKYTMPTQMGRLYDNAVTVATGGNTVVTVSGETTPLEDHVSRVAGPGPHGAPGGPVNDYSANHHTHLHLDRNNSYDATALLRRSIPSVTVDCATESFSNLNRGYGNHYMNMFYNDGYSNIDTEQPRRCSTGSALPRMEIPENQLSLLTACHPHGAKSLSTHSLDLPRGSIDQGKPTERRASAPEGENIRIVINDVDGSLRGGSGDSTEGEPRQRRVILQRDKNDASCRTRGFGMRLMGGKRGPDGHLYAIVSWVLLGSSADIAGLQKGSIVLEWNGQSLVDKPFEEVSEILDHSPDVVEILIETGRRMSPLSPNASNPNILKTGDLEDNEIDGQLDQPRAPPIRRNSGRMLPRLPGELGGSASGSGVTGGSMGTMDEGEMCVQLFYDEERSDLVVRVLSVRGLAPRKQPGRQDTVTALHRAYVKLRLSPDGGFTAMKTPVSEPAVNPEWNKSFVFPSLEPSELQEASLKLSVWEHQSTLGSQPGGQFLGDVTIPLRMVVQDPAAVSGSHWYRLRCERESLLPPPI
ncbi:uncharacterized protein LOC111248734 isoform X2 [Varroa destructor]|uniref:Regulating synaptic membrane exocytosis protein 2 n=1 Tax=Varroa destructor TaxID=109461 RepID=A0A7M7MF61_VARDE|nr:uncharacterized protein LOC111248734 isoform X2 [Varroa destructor]